jgi:hypothetical protein
MGIEYHLGVAAPDLTAVDQVLGRLWAARPAKPPQTGYNLWFEPPGQDGPEATMQVEPGGVYFCDYCGKYGRALLGVVVAALTSFGPVTVEEL